MVAAGPTNKIKYLEKAVFLLRTVSRTVSICCYSQHQLLLIVVECRLRLSLSEDRRHVSSRLYRPRPMLQGALMRHLFLGRVSPAKHRRATKRLDARLLLTHVGLGRSGWANRTANTFSPEFA